MPVCEREVKPTYQELCHQLLDVLLPDQSRQQLDLLQTDPPPISNTDDKASPDVHNLVVVVEQVASLPQQDAHRLQDRQPYAFLRMGGEDAKGRWEEVRQRRGRWREDVV